MNKFAVTVSAVSFFFLAAYIFGLLSGTTAFWFWLFAVLLLLYGDDRKRVDAYQTRTLQKGRGEMARSLADLSGSGAVDVKNDKTIQAKGNIKVKMNKFGDWVPVHLNDASSGKKAA